MAKLAKIGCHMKVFWGLDKKKKVKKATVAQVIRICHPF